MKFSILIPAYKAEYLNEAITSVLEQQYDDYELIVLDDCSPAPIGKIVQEYGDNHIKYYRNKENNGAVKLVETWNMCLQFSTGEYVICMGDDDKLKPNCLTEYAKLIKMYPDFDVYHALTEIINEKSELCRVLELRPEKESVYSMLYHRWKGRMQFVGDFLYKSKTLKERGGFFSLPMAWGSDDITSYIMAGRKGIINSQIPLFQYRISSITLTKSGNTAIKLNAILGDEAWTRKFLSDIPQNKEDYMYWEKINLMFKNNYGIKRKAALYSDMMSNDIWRFLYWLRERNKYGVTCTQIWGSLFSALISKTKKLVGDYEKV